MSLESSIAMTDEQLVEGCLIPDARAQKQLYERFSRKMFAVCLRYSSNREESEDILQEGFIKIFQKLRSYKGEGSLEGWIRKVVVNTALDHFRQQKISWIDIEMAEDQISEESTLGKLDAQELLKIIQQLPKGFRTVFNLYAIEGYNHREIGELLGISENTSKSQYSRARAQLAESVQIHYQQATNTEHP